MILAFGSLILIIAYLGMVETFYKGWNKLTDENPGEVSSLLPSVIVCCRNEEKRLPYLIDSLLSNKPCAFELILVDDHSEDGTWEYMKGISTNFCKIKLHQSAGYGKKAALREGIALAQGDFLLFTDADCIVPSSWVSTVSDYWSAHKPDLLLAPINFNSDGSLFQELQQLEMASLIASAAGSAGAGMPVLANAANMACSRELWTEAEESLREDKASGDDMFLLMYARKIKAEIHYLKSENALVQSLPNKSIQEFIAQRLRWGSKSTAIRDSQVILVTLLIFFICLFGILDLIGGLFRHTLWIYGFLIFASKWMADYFFLKKTRLFFGLKNVFRNSFLLSLVYPFYIVGIALFSLKMDPKNWRKTQR